MDKHLLLFFSRPNTTTECRVFNGELLSRHSRIRAVTLLPTYALITQIKANLCSNSHVLTEAKAQTSLEHTNIHRLALIICVLLFSFTHTWVYKNYYRELINEWRPLYNLFNYLCCKTCDITCVEEQ